MEKNISIESSITNEDIYFDSLYLSNQFFKEANTYPSSQKRLMFSKYLFALKDCDEQIGFVSAFKDPKFYDDILALDLCLTSEYRDEGIANVVLPKIVKIIEDNEAYNGEFIIIENSKSHDKGIKGIKYNDGIVLLQDRLAEMDYVHPDGIEKCNKVISSKEYFNTKDKKGLK